MSLNSGGLIIGKIFASEFWGVYFFGGRGAYCWFASDVTAAMLVVKNKRVSLRWEINSILMQILQKKFSCIDHQHGRLVTWLQTKNYRNFTVFLLSNKN